MNNKIFYGLIFLGLSLSACGQVPKNTSKGDTGRSEISPQEAMADYRAQEHRFEVRACKLYYNEQQVVLDSLHLFEKVMGENYIFGMGCYYKDKPVSFQAK